ncbi:cobalamin biosynthesis protein [uncultured Methanobrevibacter sp.]|uniref:cobalamin biosynthesis protein n=1 Tax=uncultured Methanobrevibacter sp. TaxID=253161 RepID=UPI0025E2940C|nr:cobalamin biosynthesis protein [uncultured Methanobrevibacter sp.]
MSLNIIFCIFTLIFSLIVDTIIGELPSKIHPVVIMGSIITFFKKYLIKIKSKISGLLLILTTTCIICFILYLFNLLYYFNDIIYYIIFILLLSSTYSIKMLLETATNVEDDLNDGIDKARKSVSYLVSRNTDELTESFIVSATIESLTENITDSFVAPVFYYFIVCLITLSFNTNFIYLLLIPMLYRLYNTLDAMVGYETDELKNIGYFPAKLDDLLNYIPSRIAGIYVVLSAYLLKLDGKNAFKIMMRDARNCPSPNSGFTMASTAGALNIQLNKKDTYILGDSNKDIVSSDISKAVKLSKLSIILFTLTIILLIILFYVIL